MDNNNSSVIISPRQNSHLQSLPPVRDTAVSAATNPTHAAQPLGVQACIALAINDAARNSARNQHLRLRLLENPIATEVKEATAQNRIHEDVQPMSAKQRDQNTIALPFVRAFNAPSGIFL